MLPIRVMLTIILRRSLLSVHLVMQTCWVRVIIGSIRKIAVKCIFTSTCRSAYLR